MSRLVTGASGQTTVLISATVHTANPHTKHTLYGTLAPVVSGRINNCRQKKKRHATTHANVCAGASERAAVANAHVIDNMASSGIRKSTSLCALALHVRG